MVQLISLLQYKMSQCWSKS